VSAASALAIHQAVHGYRSGHELLQTSVRLSPELQRTMLVQSDLSGSALPSGFEEYVSGYPLDGLGAYVLARTWYAPEMDRPGCVWTHSLLVAYAELARISDLSALTALFHRPTLQTAYARGSLPVLELSEPGDAPRRWRNEMSTASAPGLVAALYGTPDQPIVLLTGSARTFESLVLAIWSQQWPRLRRTFRFCTGALGAKSQDGVSFDLLVAPSTLRLRLARELASSPVVDDLAPTLVSPEWATRALQELRGTSEGLREFLWSYGADASRPRHAWRPLAETYEMLASPDTPDLAALAANLIGESFSRASDCKRLKVDLFGPAPKLRTRRDGAEAAGFLLALSTSRYPEAFADDDLRLPEQGRALWRGDRTSASNLLQTLVTEPLNPLGEAVLAALCDEVGPTAPLELERLHRGILTVLLERRPEMATSPALWKVPLDRQREFLDILMRNGADHVRLSVGAMMAAGTSGIASEVSRSLGPDAAAAVLESIDRDDELLRGALGGGWSEILAQDPDRVVHWLRRSAASPMRLAFAIRHLDPRSSAVRALAAEEWLTAAADNLEQMLPEARLRSAAFVLAIGLTTTSTEGGSLVGLAYPLVYRAASIRDGLPYEMWRWLSGELPPLHWYKDWDRCERLSFGLVERFARLEWPLQDFVRAATDADALRQAVEIARDKESRVLGSLRNEIARGALTVTAEQRRIIEERPRW
jgi:hypothetical protein